LAALIVADLAPHPGSQGRSTLSRFAMPYTFGPDLSLAGALVAVAGCLTRIFSAVALFAVWGSLSVRAWSTIANGFFRVAAELPLLLLFLAGLAALMIAISTVERILAPHR
jgi:hypothetical protein